MASQSSVARRTRGGAADDHAVLKAVARLTERDRYIIRIVAEHRVLTSDQLAALAFDNVITAPQARCAGAARRAQSLPAAPGDRVGTLALPAWPARRRAAGRRGP